MPTATTGVKSDGAAEKGQMRHPVDDVLNYLVEYSRANPEIAALWCFGIGFVLGWRLKPW